MLSFYKCICQDLWIISIFCIIASINVIKTNLNLNGSYNKHMKSPSSGFIRRRRCMTQWRKRRKWGITRYEPAGMSVPLTFDPVHFYFIQVKLSISTSNFTKVFLFLFKYRMYLVLPSLLTVQSGIEVMSITLEVSYTLPNQKNSCMDIYGTHKCCIKDKIKISHSIISLEEWLCSKVVYCQGTPS